MGRTINHSGRDEFRKRQSAHAKIAIAKRNERLPDDHPSEIKRRADEAALIRFENDERKRLIEDGPQNPPPSFRVTKQIRRTGKAIDFDR